MTETHMIRIYAALAIIAAVILLYTFNAVAFWLAMTIAILGLIYMIVTSVAHFARSWREEVNHA